MTWCPMWVGDYSRPRNQPSWDRLWIHYGRRLMLCVEIPHGQCVYGQIWASPVYGVLLPSLKYSWDRLQVRLTTIQARIKQLL